MALSLFLTLLNFITALRSLFLGPLTIERQGRTIFTNLKKQLTQAPVRMPKLLSSCLPFRPWKGVDATATLIKITGKKSYWNFPPTVCALHAVKSVLNCRRTQQHSVCHLTCCKTLSLLRIQPLLTIILILQVSFPSLTIFPGQHILDRPVSLLLDLQDTLFLNAAFNWFTDGSYLHPLVGSHQAIVSLEESLESGPLPNARSAQA